MPGRLLLLWAALITQLLLALLMPLMAGAMSAAWKQMRILPPEGVPPVPRILTA